MALWQNGTTRGDNREQAEAKYMVCESPESRVGVGIGKNYKMMGSQNDRVKETSLTRAHEQSSRNKQR